MASRFKLYNADGISEIYTFPLVQKTNFPQSPLRHIVLNGVRGIGALIIPAGTPIWTLEIDGILAIDGSSEGYDELTAKITEMESLIALNTAYYIRIYKTSTTYDSVKVKRVEVISYPESLRTDSQHYGCKFLVDAW